MCKMCMRFVFWGVGGLRNVIVEAEETYVCRWGGESVFLSILLLCLLFVALHTELGFFC